MKSKGKRIIGILLSIALVFTMMPVLGLSQMAYAVNGDTWSEDQIFNDDASFEFGVEVTSNITITIAEGKTVRVENEIYAWGKTLTVEGKGNLIVNGYNSSGGSGGSAFTGSIIVKGGKVTLTGGEGNPDGENDKGGNGIEGNVEVLGGSFSATGGNGHTVGQAVHPSNYITCENGIVAQESANGSEWSDISDDRSNKQYVRTIQTYPLWVGGTRVTSVNMNDVLVNDPVNAGKVSYTPAEGDSPAKLTLKGANITTGHGHDNYGIHYTGNEPLTIESQSGTDNTIIGTEPFSRGIISERSAITFSGEGSLTTEGNYSGIEASGVTIDGSSVTAISNRCGILPYGDVVIKSGDVTANGVTEFGFYNYNGNVIIEGGNVIAVGGVRGIYNTVKNAIAGTGWTNTAGTEGEEAIAISGSDGQELDYKKVQFLSAEPVDVTLNYCKGHNRLFTSDTLDMLAYAVGADEASMSDKDTTIILKGVPGSMTEADLRAILDGFVQELKGEDDDWLIDSGELYAAVGYKPLDKYKSLQEVAEDIGEESTKHDVPINSETPYYLLWAKAIKNIQLDNGSPICGKEADSSMPKAPTGTVRDEEGSYWFEEGVDMEHDFVETFKGGKEYTCQVALRIDPKGTLWNKFFDDNATKVSVKGGKDVKRDADTPGELYVTFKATADHDWDAGKVTKKPTEKATGVKIYTCKVKDCGAKKTESIPKLKPAVSGTQTAKMKVGKKSVTIGWNKIKGAAGYDIFFARCNHGKKEIKCKKVKTIKGNKTFSWTKSGLKKGTAYKAYVKAYVMKNGKKSYVRTSPVMHAYTGNVKGKFTNAKAVSVNKTKIVLKKGKTFKVKAKVTKVKKNKKLMPKKHVKTVRYLTTNKKVATVSASGKITAKGKGTCTIVAFAHNGVSKSIKVTVK